jgi:hypothetical protein
MACVEERGADEKEPIQRRADGGDRLLGAGSTADATAYGKIGQRIMLSVMLGGRRT